MPPNDKFIAIVQRDPTLTSSEKEELIEKLRDHEEYESMLRGASGAGIGYVTAKFLNLPKQAQILLSLAGFGIGKYLLDVSRKRDKFLQYNDKLKVYDIKA